MSRTGRQFLQRGLLDRIEYTTEREEPSVCIIFKGAKGAWRIRIYAKGEPGPQSTGWVYVGSVRVLPWNGSDRCIAMVGCPGATCWAVDGQPEDHANNEQPSVDFMGSKDLAEFGVHSIPGVSLLYARHITSFSGVQGVTAGGPLVGYSCIAGVVDATVTLSQDGNTTVITVPAGSTFTQTFTDGAGVVNSVIFANTISYVADYITPGDGLDVV